MLNHLDTVIGFVVVLLGVSLLITILTQMAAAVLGLRGTNLKWGIATLLETLSPELKDHAEIISQKVLQHPLISDSTISRFRYLPFVADRWTLASAIDGEELLKILKRLAEEVPTDEPGATQSDTDAGRKALAQLGVVLKQISPQAQAVETGAQEILKLTQELKAQLPAASSFDQHLAKIDELAQQALANTGKAAIATTQELTDLKHWFDAMMGRVSQRFTFQTRLWTVCFAILLAFGMHLDAIELFKRLATDAELRGQLAASADTMRNHAQDVLAVATTPMQNASQDELKARLATLQDQAVAIRSELDKEAFQLIPTPYPGLLDFKNRQNFFGILATAALLSLGAPFWFNALKTLGNLKPVVANKIEQQQTPS